MTVISVDAGTSVIKAVAHDRSGAESAVARRTVPVRRPSTGHAEQDMAAVWDAVAQTVADVVGRVDDPVTLVAVTAQGDGAWLVDASGAPTGPAVLWNDGRAAPIVDRWTRSGVVEKVFPLNGSLPFPGLPAAVLAWLAENDRARLDRTAAVLSCGGWIHARMTGRTVMDTSDASAPFLDARTQQPSQEILDLYGIGWAAGLLPPVVDGGDRVAPLLDDVAAQWGIPAGTPVVMAPYDIVATAIGCGALSHGQAVSILGTTLCTETVVEGAPDTSLAVGFTIATGLPGRHLRALPTLAGTEVLHWSARALGLPDATALVGLAATAEPGARGLVFLPYLSPAGERAPFLDPRMRGGFVGLSFDHDREHLARAVVEGLALVVADCLAAAAVPPTELTICGGAAGNPVLAQIIADVSGVPVHRTADAEIGARGAHLVGLALTGGAATVEEAARTHVRVVDTFTPDPLRSNRYAAVRAQVLALRDGVRAHGEDLRAIRETFGAPASPPDGPSPEEVRTP